MASKTNPTATITNNLGYDVDIYDVFNPNVASTQGPLMYKKLATVPKGASAQQVSTIHFASQLQAMRTGNITALNNNYYLQFPVAVLAVSPFANPNAFTLTSYNQQSMEDSFKFIKYTQANASSILAKDFRTALGDANSQKNAVNQFFLSTGSFKKCTLSTWTAVMSWQAQFTNPWQGTYYLYNLGSGSTDGSTTGSSAPALVATLVIAASATKDWAVLTMEDTNDENTPVVMGGDGSMQEQDQGTGDLSVDLTPTWLNIAQTSEQDGTTVINYVIGVAFTGTINGQKVTGNLNKLPPAHDSSSPSNGFTLSTLTELVGMLTGIGMLYYMAKDHKQSEMQKKNDVQGNAKDAADAAAQRAQVRAQYQANDVSQVAEKGAQLENSIVPQVPDGYKAVDQAVKVQQMESVIDQNIDALKDVLDGGAPSQNVKDAAANLLNAKDSLKDAVNPALDPAARDAVLRDTTSKLNSASEALQQELADQGSVLSQEQKEKVEDAQNAAEEQMKEADARDENQKEQENKDREDPWEDVDPKSFDPPIEGK